MESMSSGCILECIALGGLFVESKSQEQEAVLRLTCFSLIRAFIPFYFIIIINSTASQHSPLSSTRNDQLFLHEHHGTTEIILTDIDYFLPKSPS